MIRVAICDDEIHILEKIQEIIKQGFEAYDIKCSYFVYTSAKELVEAQRTLHFDIAFLDIMMPEYSGFEAAADIRRLHSKTYIIFITSNDESVYDAFEFQPFHFVRKDCDDIFESRMKHVIASLARHMKQEHTIILSLPFSDEKKLKASDIIAIKSDRNYLEIHCSNDTVLRIRNKLSEIESELLEYDFIRTHNRWLVNMLYIQLPDYPNDEVMMVNGLAVPLSRSNKNELQKKYAEYLRSI